MVSSKAMMATISECLENFITECGGFGRFQFFLILVVFLAMVPTTWTTLMMSFAGAIPDIICVKNSSSITYASNHNMSLMYCKNDNSSECETFGLDDSMHTVVSEFHLLCDKDWVVATITTIQFGGLLAGAFISGHLSDYVGRKPILYLSLLVLGTMNLIAYFSVTWQMFAVLRFFLGFGAGTYLVVYFPLMIEFISMNKRPVVAGLPAWTCWASLFGLVAWLLPHWAHLHLVNACITVPLLFTYWVFPESFRWLVTRRRINEAEDIITKMAKTNGVVVPDISQIQNIPIQENEKKYTLKDLFQDKYLTKNTLLHAVMWFSCGYVYYAISFGVQKLSGSLYLNLFLVGIVEVPGNLLTILMSNVIGRKWTSCGFFCISGLASIAVAVVQTIHLDPDVSGKLINAFALTSKLGVAAGWCSLHVLTSEMYPTVVRNIGYGFQNTATRIGAMIAPQMVFLSNKVPGILYYLSGLLMLSSSLCAFLSSETRGIVLSDTLTEIKIPEPEKRKSG